HWSKGFDVYQALDEALAAGRLPGFEFWVVGRWPDELKWRAARTFGPASGMRLAGLLRQCHIYVTASRFEPGANHTVEGLQCGLPVLFHPDSGGSVSQCAPYGLPLGGDVAASILDLRSRYGELRQRLLENPPSGLVMCAHYARLVQRLVAEAAEC
ncbi:MAG: glycosyltransferase, partial [Terrimicrobiaceae bacterium]|nr:glycosyltransferase [Terrimicrobiaceae bacterium]